MTPTLIELEVKIPYMGYMKLGARGKRVRAVKRALARAGYGKLWGSRNGLFGPFMVIHLKRFQKKHSLTQSGEYTAVTHGQLKRHFDDYARLLYVGPDKAPQGSFYLPVTFTPTHQTAGLPGYPAVDVFGAAGSVVLAPEDGQIRRLSGKDPALGGIPGSAYGWNIYLTGKTGDYFLAHFGSRSVIVGQNVTRGMRLGTVCDAAVAKMPSSSSHIHCGKREF